MKNSCERMKKQWAMSRHDGWYVDYSRRDREWERKRESETQRFIINNDIYIFFFSTSAAAYRRRRFDDWEPRWSDTTCNIDATFYFVKQFVVFFFFYIFFLTRILFTEHRKEKNEKQLSIPVEFLCSHIETPSTNRQNSPGERAIPARARRTI